MVSDKQIFFVAAVFGILLLGFFLFSPSSITANAVAVDPNAKRGVAIVIVVLISLIIGMIEKEL